MSVGMVFALIFAIVVISFVIFFGFNVIMNIFCTGENAQIQKTVKEIKNLVENQVYPKSKGFSEVYTLNIPENTKICFVNSSDPRPNLAGDWIPDPVYENLIKENDYTLWITFCGGESGYHVNYLRILPEENFCAGPGSELYFENIGKWVSVEKISD